MRGGAGHPRHTDQAGAAQAGSLYTTGTAAGTATSLSNVELRLALSADTIADPTSAVHRAEAALAAFGERLLPTDDELLGEYSELKRKVTRELHHLRKMVTEGRNARHDASRDDVMGQIMRPSQEHVVDDEQDLSTTQKKELEKAKENRSTQRHGAYGVIAIAAKNLVENEYFQGTIALCILGSGVIVGMLTYERIKREHESMLEVLDTCILVVFTLEMLCKIVAEGSHPWKYWFK
eukprot:SAG31_NODE_11184_length_1057_cov_1.283925_2_plen_236_part_00